jgi:hypothetical protein
MTARLNVNLLLDRCIHDRALVVAENEDRTMANLIRRALRLYIEAAETRADTKPEPLAPPYDSRIPRLTRWPPDEYDMPDSEDEHQQDATAQPVDNFGGG